MSELKIKRINKNRFQVKKGNEVVRECTSFKEAVNAILFEDMFFLDTVELEDTELIESYSEAA